MSLRNVLLIATVLAIMLAAATARAQTVQLPTYRSFSISTTVSVPDRGGMYLGGVDRAQYGSSSYGVPGLGRVPVAGRLFGNRAIGSSVGSSGAFATATIIDHREMDARLLAEAAARRGLRTGTGYPEAGDAEESAPLLLASSGSERVDRTATSDGLPAGASLVEIRARREAANAKEVAELQAWLDRGQQAEAAGRWGAARCCYAVVVQRGPEALRSIAQARLAQLDPK
jgi:type II secretory pathway component HofQ